MQYFIGGLSKETGFGIHTLRFYEKKKLIFPKRDPQNRRIYSENDLFRLNIIKNFKIIGTSLEDMEEYFHLFEYENQGKEERKTFLLAEKEKITSKIEHLQAAEDFINELLVKCHLLPL